MLAIRTAGGSETRRYRVNFDEPVRLTLWQVGAQPFEPALPVLRMNRPAGRFTRPPLASIRGARHRVGRRIGANATTPTQRLPGSMNLNRPLQIKMQIQKQKSRRDAGATKGNGAQTRLSMLPEPTVDWEHRAR